MSFRDGKSHSQQNIINLIDKIKAYQMKTNTLIAVILITIAIVAFGYQGITYTTREKVVDLGPLQMTAEKTRTLPLPPIVGAIALAGGILLLVLRRKKD
jgi:LPXTG-motif cell wall-anchored protein